MNMSFEGQYNKNYLLVPLSIVKNAENQIQYKLDFEIIESTVNEKMYVSV
jgi:hypothetical protein